MRAWLYLLIFTLLCFVAGGTAAAEEDENNAALGSAENPHVIPKISQGIAIDGELNEAAWSSAYTFDLNYEIRPGENISPPVKTILYLMYDDTHLYVGFRAHDPNPEDIRARLTDRDSAFADDFVGIVIDTFNDQRRAFEFFVNPFGVQMDLIQDDINDSEDSSWNAIWDSAGTINEQGYQVEMAIPFTQIRFQDSEDNQTWGLDAVRVYPRTDRTLIALNPRDRDVNSYLSQLMKIKGFKGVERGRNLEITPTVTAFKTQARPDFPNGDLEDSTSDSDAGVSLRWGVTPNMTINGTINPDFSQIEADSVQLDINQTFALYFQETRPFFLDQADYFDTPMMNLVYTRNVADPSYAVKVTGKEGPHTFGIFTAEDEVTNLIVPGSFGSDSGSFGFKSQATVARYRYDLGENSTIGASLIDRQGDGYQNTVLAVDTRYQITENDMFRASFAGSQSTYNQEVIDHFGMEDGEISDRALSMSYRHSTRNYWVNASYTDYGKDFRADVGFIPQVDYTKIIVGGGREFWGEEGAFFRRITISGDWDKTEDQSGNLIEEEYEAYIYGIAPRNIFFFFGGGVRDRAFNGVTFDNHWLQGELNGDFTSFFRGGAFVRRGKYIDFANTREADRFYVNFWSQTRLGDHFSVNFGYNYEILDVEGGQRLYSTHVPEVRAVYQFDRRMFIRAIFQYVNINRDPALYKFDVNESTETLLSQLLFSYKINPQTVLYLGYSDNYRGNQNYDLTQTDRTLFMKIGYAWLQ